MNPPYQVLGTYYMNQTHTFYSSGWLGSESGPRRRSLRACSTRPPTGDAGKPPGLVGTRPWSRWAQTRPALFAEPGSRSSWGAWWSWSTPCSPRGLPARGNKKQKTGKQTIANINIVNINPKPKPKLNDKDSSNTKQPNTDDQYDLYGIYGQYDLYDLCDKYDLDHDLNYLYDLYHLYDLHDLFRGWWTSFWSQTQINRVNLWGWEMKTHSLSFERRIRLAKIRCNHGSQQTKPTKTHVWKKKNAMGKKREKTQNRKHKIT